MYDLGSRLKSIRLQWGMTQKTLARKVNKSVSAISSYESNAQMPPLDVLESIALVLHVSIDFLVGFNSSQVYSIQRLTPEQAEIVDLLFREFDSRDVSHEQLTDQQISILQKLIRLFCNHIK